MPDAIEAPVAPEAPAVDPKAEAAAAGISGEPKSETPKAPEPAPAQRLHKLKVSGREVEVPEDELIEAGKTAAQMRRAAAQQFEEAKRLRAEAEALKKRLTESPEDALAEALGGAEKVDALAEARLLRKLQLEQMNPDQRARLEAERALESERKARQKMEEDIKAREARALEQHMAQEFDARFTEALKENGLPKTPETVRRLAQLQRKALEMGLDLEPKRMARIILDDIAAEQSATLAQLEGERLLGALGPELRKRIRAAEVAAVKGGGAPAPKPVAPVQPERPKKALTQDEWREWMLNH